MLGWRREANGRLNVIKREKEQEIGRKGIADGETAAAAAAGGKEDAL